MCVFVKEKSMTVSEKQNDQLKTALCSAVNLTHVVSESAAAPRGASTFPSVSGTVSDRDFTRGEQVAGLNRSAPNLLRDFLAWESQLDELTRDALLCDARRESANPKLPRIFIPFLESGRMTTFFHHW